MRLSVRGRGRDHGRRTINDDDLTEAEIATGNSMRSTYIQVVRSETGIAENLVISKGAALRLNGDYAVEAEFSPSEIARLFYLTHSNMDLHDLIEALAPFKQVEDERVKAATELRQKLMGIKIRRRV